MNHAGTATALPYDPRDGHSSALYGDDLSTTYDPIYNARRDVARESAELRNVAIARHPHPATWLDVGCGTGEHLRYLREHVDAAGLEKSDSMRRLAQEKNPEIPILSGDLRTMELDRSFDVITCLYATLAYCADPNELADATQRIASHLNPGGLLIIDPWWFPENFVDGYVSESTVRDGDRTIIRVSHSTREDRTVLQTAHFLIAAADTGIAHHLDVQRLTLFTEGEYAAALVAGGCSAAYLAPSQELTQFPRGLFVGIRQ